VWWTPLAVVFEVTHSELIRKNKTNKTGVPRKAELLRFESNVVRKGLRNECRWYMKA
jgi:hypothetical protein